MRKHGDYDDDGYLMSDQQVPYSSTGSLHGVSSDTSADRVRELREVVAEVTMGRIPVPQKRGPRFQ